MYATTSPGSKGSLLIMAVANGVMAVIFLFFAALQFNDPDPGRWIAVYFAAAVLSAGAALGWRGRLPPWMWPTVLAVIATLWSLSIWRGIVGPVSTGELFGTMGMKTSAVEETRESLGLLIVAAWMVVVIYSHLRWSRRRRSPRVGHFP